jgi:hypothetical protein
MFACRLQRRRSMAALGAVNPGMNRLGSRGTGVPGKQGEPQARWVLGVGIPWPLRVVAIFGYLVLAAMSWGGEFGALFVGWAVLGASTGLWGSPWGSPVSRAVILIVLVPWLAVWTSGTIMVTGWLQLALYGRDVIELRPDELRAVPRWPRPPVRVATAGIRGVYLLARRGDLMARTDSGSVKITEMGTDDERAALTVSLRELLAVPVTWRPALPAGYRTEHCPEGLVVVPGEGAAAEWLIGPGTVTVRARSAGTVPGDVIFTGCAAELTASVRAEDDDEYLACELVLRGEDGPEPGGGRYLLLRERADPTVPRELALWLVTAAEITLDDQIPE